MLQQIKKELAELGSPEKAEVLAGFFKTGKGEYGEGDVFLGVKVPEARQVAKRHVNTRLEDTKELLMSGVHEHRLTALLILVEQYAKGGKEEKQRIFDFYTANAKRVNNWDLVDLTAHKIIGEHLRGRGKDLLDRLARSESLWERRIAIIATLAYIRTKEFEDTFRISEILLNDEHGLIHKATGWMLREVGKIDQEAEERFLRKHCKKMPRTMLRYAVERFGEEKRRYYLGKR